MAADGQTGHCRRLAAETKGGKGTVWFPCPLLTPPNPPLRRDSLRSRGEMRGAHRDVWCSKGTPMIEAELFAGQGERPAPSGRALLCAASYARKIQGNKASKNLPDARNRAPVTPVSLHISDVSAQRKVRGVKRGQETIRCPVPFCPSPWARRFPPVNTGAPRRRRRPLSTPSEGVKPPPAAHRCIGGRFTVCRRYKRKGRCPVGDNLQNVHI